MRRPSSSSKQPVTARRSSFSLMQVSSSKQPLFIEDALKKQLFRRKVPSNSKKTPVSHVHQLHSPIHQLIQAIGGLLIGCSACLSTCSPCLRFWTQCYPRICCAWGSALPGQPKSSQTRGSVGSAWENQGRENLDCGDDLGYY